MLWKPNRWIAILIAIVFQPLSFLYVDRPRLAAGFLVFNLAIALILTIYFNHAFAQIISIFLPFAFMILSAVWTYRIASRFSPLETRPTYTKWFSLVSIALGLIILALVCRMFFYEPFKAPSSSMEPTIAMNSVFIVKKWGFGHYGTYGLKGFRRPISVDVKRGDIIAFDYPFDNKITYLKRVVGIPGDKIVYHRNHLYINGTDTLGRKIQDFLTTDNLRYVVRYIEDLDGIQHEVIFRNFDNSITLPHRDFESMNQCTFSSEQITCDVPSNRYFVLGDYRDNSADSRNWGFVRADQIIGRVDWEP